MSNTQPEPSMEEILASIRRIISEDEDETRAPQSAPTAAQPRARQVQAAPVQVQPQPAPREPAQVSQFQAQTTQQPEPQLVARPAPEPARRPAPQVQTAPQQAAMQPPQQPTIVQQPAMVARPQPQVAVQSAPLQQVPTQHAVVQPAAKQVVMSQTDAHENILSDNTVAAASKAFQSLSQKVKVSQSGEGKSLEEIVTDMLRPMVKEWLEANLAGIVEEKVEAEVKRLSRQGR